jgi:hypothetical protein
MRAYTEFRAQPWLINGQPVRTLVINTGDPLADQEILAQQEMLEPNAPLTRPATNADWIDPLVDLLSLAAVAAGPELRLAGPASEAIDGAGVSANAAESAFATTEGVAVSGGRAIDRAASYEIGVRRLVHQPTQI